MLQDQTQNSSKETTFTTDTYILTIFCDATITLHFVSRTRKEKIELFADLKHEDLPRELQVVCPTIEDFAEMLGDSDFFTLDMDACQITITTYLIAKNKKIERKSVIPLKKIERSQDVDGKLSAEDFSKLLSRLQSL